MSHGYVEDAAIETGNGFADFSDNFQGREGLVFFVGFAGGGDAGDEVLVGWVAGKVYADGDDIDEESEQGFIARWTDIDGVADEEVVLVVIAVDEGSESGDECAEEGSTLAAGVVFQGCGEGIV